MIDLGLLRQKSDTVAQLIKTKDPLYDAAALIELDAHVRELRHKIEQLQQRKNELAAQAKSGITDEVRSESKTITVQLKEQMAQLEQLEADFKQLYLMVPNLPLGEVPVGGKEHNKVVKEGGEKPSYDFPVKNHVELAEQLGWIDFAAAARLAGSNFALFKSEAVNLVYSLGLYMLKNNIAHGYEAVLPSVLVNEQTLQTSGNFPKFKDQVYSTQDGLFLSPTAEVNLASMYRNHMFGADDLPVRMTAWTSCFRREAGNYGAQERGLIRIHQFEKVELFTLCEPDQSNHELERMLACAEKLLQDLGLHYRVSLLATQDMSFQAAKTYDIEVWLPGQNCYYEVSSVSNCTDFQARRGMMRYKKTGDKKARLVHTLNGSSLALPRLIVALLETYQQPDGTIALPDTLKNAMIF